MPLDLNRFKNLFGAPSKGFQEATQPMPFPTQAPPPVMPQEEEPMQNQSLQRFLDMAAPERQNPSLLSKIGATMMSLKATPEQVDKSLNFNYYRDVADHQRNTDNLLKGAAIESQQNNYRSLNDYRNIQGQTAQTRAATGQVNAGANVMRAETAKMLAGMPNVRVKPGQGGQPDIYYDSKSGKQVFSSPSGTMDPELKFKMEQEGRMDLADVNNDAAMDRTLTTETGATQRNDADNQTAVTVAGMPARATNPTAVAPTEARRKENVRSRAQVLIKQFPEIAITFDDTGNIVLGDMSEKDKAIIINWLNDTGPTALPNGKEEPPIVPPSSGVPMTGANNPVNASPIGGRGNKPTSQSAPVADPNKRADGAVLMTDGRSTKWVKPEHMDVAGKANFKPVPPAKR